MDQYLEATANISEMKNLSPVFGIQPRALLPTTTMPSGSTAIELPRVTTISSCEVALSVGVAAVATGNLADARWKTVSPTEVPDQDNSRYHDTDPDLLLLPRFPSTPTAHAPRYFSLTTTVDIDDDTLAMAAAARVSESPAAAMAGIAYHPLVFGRWLVPPPGSSPASRSMTAGGSDDDEERYEYGGHQGFPSAASAVDYAAPCDVQLLPDHLMPCFRKLSLPAYDGMSGGGTGSRGAITVPAADRTDVAAPPAAAARAATCMTAADAGGGGGGGAVLSRSADRTTPGRHHHLPACAALAAEMSTSTSGGSSGLSSGDDDVVSARHRRRSAPKRTAAAAADVGQDATMHWNADLPMADVARALGISLPELKRRWRQRAAAASATASPSSSPTSAAPPPLAE
ncbi:hypothetical protein PLESTB_000723100 [Pleodorina starrii]|uniref:Uncharacterized protein n=1 Tax=Pleodorina starrii TaxID=330485 RepID=A0A9W6BJC0_9CHLO|nr:hypothetical protein PLESTM_001704300 [Pleodorina starrii]GLC53237.1 hypothetical protein PLESTB_000723100 [Pleodorina starrii]GLC68691.1 hypothetical protein PLESTF_000723600 [Pleodorina starrii]